MIRQSLWRVLAVSLWLLASSLAYGRALPDAIEFGRVIELGDVARAREWLDAGLSPDFEGKPIGTGLMIAAWTGNIPMMALFVERGANINKANAIGEQALLHAAWKGQREAVGWLLDHGATPKRDGQAWAALHYAAFAGHAEVVRALLARGADVNALSPNGSTPLMMAAREGHEGVAAGLLQAGADPSVTNEWGDNAETWALRQNNTKIARLVATSDPSLRKPIVRGVPRRSMPVPDAADRLLARARELEDQGKRDEALKAFKSAMAAIRRAEQDQARMQARKTAELPRQVAGLKISARRSNPDDQRASLHYERPANNPRANTGSAEAANIGAGGPRVDAGRTAPTPESAQAVTAQDPVERLLAEARQLDAAGKRTEALRRYRQAAALLRQL